MGRKCFIFSTSSEWIILFFTQQIKVPAINQSFMLIYFISFPDQSRGNQKWLVRQKPRRKAEMWLHLWRRSSGYTHINNAFLWNRLFLKQCLNTFNQAYQEQQQESKVQMEELKKEVDQLKQEVETRCVCVCLSVWLIRYSFHIISFLRTGQHSRKWSFTSTSCVD